MQDRLHRLQGLHAKERPAADGNLPIIDYNAYEEMPQSVEADFKTTVDDTEWRG